MAINRTRRSKSTSRRGAIIVLFAVMLVVILAFIALSVELGYLSCVRTDLQAAVDAGALAGTGALADGRGKAEKAAKQFTLMNLNNEGVRSGNKQNIQVELGHWNSAARTFTEGAKPIDAVRVTAQAERLSVFFGRAIGADRFISRASATATYQPRDVMLVLDVSGSMAEARNGVRKIDELRSSVKAFLSYIREAKARDRVGYSFYASDASLGSQLSYDLNQVEKSMMNNLEPKTWTNIADGMKIAIDELAQNKRDNAASLIVLLTDGAANINQPGDVYDPAEAKRRVIQHAYDARDRGYPIFTIALDSLTTEVDVALMEQVAQITGSETFHVIAGETESNGVSQLREAFRRVATNRPLRIVD